MTSQYLAHDLMHGWMGDIVLLIVGRTIELRDPPRFHCGNCNVCQSVCTAKSVVNPTSTPNSRADLGGDN